MIEIYTDGSYKKAKNYSVGGYAIVVVIKKNKSQVYTKGWFNTTSNRMELRAVIDAFAYVPPKSRAVIFTDSKYILDGLRTMKANPESVEKWKNKDLWIVLFGNLVNSEVTIKWIPRNSTKYHKIADAHAYHAMQEIRELHFDLKD